MIGYLLDTNVVSEYSRKTPPHPRVKAWVDLQAESSLYLSVLTLGEIRKGTSLLPRGDRRTQLERWLELDLPARFVSRLLEVNAKIADLWGAMAGEAQLNGIALATIDGLIAATAKHHSLTLVTRNVRDFRIWGIPLLNPWELS